MLKSMTYLLYVLSSITSTILKSITNATFYLLIKSNRISPNLYTGWYTCNNGNFLVVNHMMQ